MKNLRNYALSILTFIFLGFLSVNCNKINAESFEIITPQYSIEVFENKPSDVTFSFALKNISQTENLITNYKFILPFESVQNFSAKINNVALSSNISSNENLGVTNASLDFSSNLIKRGEAANIQINFQTSKILNTLGELKVISFGNQSVGDKLKFQNINLLYPQSFGEPSNSSIENYNVIKVNEKYKLEIINNNDSKILIYFGDNYSTYLSTEFELVNTNENESIKALYNLIPTNQSQSALYSNLTANELGYFDNFNNEFGALNLSPDDSANVIFNAKVSKNSNNPSFIKSSIEISVDELSDNYSLLKEIIDNEELSTTQKLKDLNDFVVSNFTPSTKLSYKFDNEKLKIDLDKNQLTPLEYVSIIAFFVHNLDLDYSIRYGYRNFPLNASINSNPYFWIMIKNNEDLIILDPFMQDLTGINYANLNTEFDKTLMGVFSSKQQYNPVLGLIDGDEKIQSVKFINNVDAEEFLINENNNNLDLKFETKEKKINSGFYFSGTLIASNSTSKNFKVNTIFFDNREVDSIVSNNLKPLLLANQTNTIELSNFREPNFFYTGEKNAEIKIISDNFQFTTNNLLFFQPHRYTILLTTFLITSSVLIYGLYQWLISKNKK